MHLTQLRLKNFRSCDETVIDFHEDLTLLAGENNAGKTNVLDALRIITSPSEVKRSLTIEPTDVRRGAASFDIEAEYAGLSDAQRGLFLVALNGVESSRATLGATYTPPPPKERRGRLARWVGPLRGGDPEPAERELIRHVHLPALRDAARELASSSPGRIEFLLRQTSEEADREAFVARAQIVLTELAGHDVVTKVEKRVSDHMTVLTTGAELHTTKLGFADPKLAALARDLRFRLARAGLPATDLGESGLGYANLLFLASVLVELRAAQDAELTLFLVEEPEAHLHPQLQALTLEFLRDEARASRVAQRGAGEHAGRIQIIATTHSPNLTAALSVKHVVVIRSVTPPPKPTAETKSPDGSEAATTESKNETWPCAKAISIATLKLQAESVRKLDRYLNVTRAALLFARRVLLVEGIAEALLFPVAAEILFKSRREDLARFRGSSLIAIDGVDFNPYLDILLTPAPVGGACIAHRLVVVTDRDDGTSGERRSEVLKKRAAALGGAERFEVHATPVTLEAALFSGLGAEMMKRTFLKIHGKSAGRWTKEVGGPNDDERARAFVGLLKATETRKGDFAQVLAEEIAKLKANELPSCLRDPLESLVAAP